MSKAQPFTFEKFKEIYSQVPRLCVDLVIKRDDKVLLILRTKHGWENQWHLPGGTVYFRETLTDAIHRVAQDEVGLKIKVEKMLGTMEYFSEKKERGFGYTISIAFLCTLVSGTLSDGQWFAKLPKNTVVEQQKFLENL